MNSSRRLELRSLLLQKRWLLPLAGTLAVASVAYLLAMRFLFPYGELRRWTESQFRTAGLEAKLEGLGPGPFLGLAATSVLVAPLDAPERKTEFRDVRVRLPFLSLLSFRPAVKLTAAAMGGDFSARWRLGKSRVLDLAWSGIEMAKAPLSPYAASIALGGRCSGTLELAEAGERAFSGSATASVSNAKLGPGSVGGFPLPGIALGTGQFYLTARGGKVTVHTAKFAGGELDASFNGDIEIPPDETPAAVNGTLSLLPRGRAVEDLAFLLALLQDAKNPDGSYTSQIKGRMGSVVFSPISSAR